MQSKPNVDRTRRRRRRWRRLSQKVLSSKISEYQGHSIYHKNQKHYKMPHKTRKNNTYLLRRTPRQCDLSAGSSRPEYQSLRHRALLRHYNTFDLTRMLQPKGFLFIYQPIQQPHQYNSTWPLWVNWVSLPHLSHTVG